jgi:TldD protein
MLLEIDKATRSANAKLLKLEEYYYDVDQKVVIVNSDGLRTEDRRISTRVRFRYAVGDEKQEATDWYDYTKPQGFEALEKTDDIAAYIKEKMHDTSTELYADSIKSCRLPVVIEAGNGGTLWHESCGHTLEASSVSMGQSAFAGKLGEKVASDRVTLIDDGTLPGMYGSSAIDDEGHPRQKNVLIEKGVLKQYLCDRLHGRKIGMESNGCGRRQNYTYAPTSRMSNTFLALGQDDHDEMIRSIDKGLYVKSLGGGTGGVLFSIAAKGAYLICNGKLDKPVKNVMLTGNGIEVIKKIDRVGNIMEYDMGAFCGAASGLIPTTTFQPRVRISEMIIGGCE